MKKNKIKIIPKVNNDPKFKSDQIIVNCPNGHKFSTLKGNSKEVNCPYCGTNIKI